MSFKDLARSMIELGIPVVPACEPGGRPSKRCILPYWQYQASADPERIERWNSEYPRANVALVAKGHVGDICFVDDDLGDTIQQAAKDMGRPLPITRVHRSGGGRGRHSLFRATAKAIALGNCSARVKRDGRMREAWSFKVANQCVVGPGSVHPETGNLYKVESDAPIADIPDWLVAWMEAKAGPSRAAHKGEVPEVCEDFDFDDFRQWLEDDCGVEIISVRSPWYNLRECPFAERRHEQAGGGAIFFDGAHLGWSCLAGGCDGHKAGIGGLLRLLAEKFGRYDNPIWGDGTDEDVEESDDAADDGAQSQPAASVAPPPPPGHIFPCGHMHGFHELDGCPDCDRLEAAARAAAAAMPSPATVAAEPPDAEVAKVRAPSAAAPSAVISPAPQSAPAQAQTQAPPQTTATEEAAEGEGDEAAPWINEYSIATDFVARHRGDTRHDGLHWSQYHPETGLWGLDDDPPAFRRAQAAIEGAIKWAADAKDITKALSFRRHSATQAILKIASNSADIRVSPDAFDRENAHLLAVRNGVIDLRVGELLPRSPEHMLRLAAPVDFDPAAESNEWKRVVHEIFGGDEDLIRYVQMAIGYTLTGSVAEECFFLCVGEGGNGKGTILETVAAAIGPYATSVDFRAFTSDSRRDPERLYHALRGKRMVLAGETERGSKLSEEAIKAWTGGDVVSARALYREAYTYRPVGKIWLSANELPTISETTEGIWRRARLIPFACAFRAPEIAVAGDAKADRSLKRRLRRPENLAGVLAWCVEGARLWHASGLETPCVVRDATEVYRAEQNPVLQFAAERCSFAPGRQAQARSLYAAYDYWCRESGHRPLSERNFRREVLRLHGVTHARTQQHNVYRGIGLVEHGWAADPAVLAEAIADTDGQLPC